jgi:hypothetical protein
MTEAEAAGRSPNLKQTLPSYYVLHHTTRYCACCGQQSSQSELFECYEEPSRLGLRRVRHLVPVNDFRYNMRVEILERNLTTPACVFCITTVNLSALPRLPERDRRRQPILTTLGQGAEAEAAGATRRANVPRKSVDIGTILNLF